MGMSILSAKDHPAAFLMVETGRAEGVPDGRHPALRPGRAIRRTPADYMISSASLGVEPYGLMMRKDDPEFKKVVDDAMAKLYKSGEIDEDLQQVVHERRSRRRASTSTCRSATR